MLSRMRALLKRALPTRLKDRLQQWELFELLAWKTKPFASAGYPQDFSAALEPLVKPGWVCADVGANKGHITALLAERVGPSGKVVAFEAFPRNARVLRARVARSPLRERVTIENVAVADRSGFEVPLYAGPASNHEFWSITTDYHNADRETDPVLRVPTVALDDYFPMGSPLDLVKIDVEGAEGLVLGGMRRLLTETRPIVAVEFHGERGWQSHEQLLKAGYRLMSCTMGEQRLNPIDDPATSGFVDRVMALPT